MSRAHAWVYRKTGGRALARMGGQPVLLLTTRGRRSGALRTTPLQFVRAGDALLVVAANGGGAQPPAWLANVRAAPLVQVQLGAETETGRAHVAGHEERAALWPQVLRANPRLAKVQDKAGRTLPVVVLEPA